MTNQSDFVQDFPSEQVFAAKDVIDAAKTDLNFLAPLVLGDIFTLEYPAMYLAFWQFLLDSVNSEERSYDRLALGIPRGFTKTVLAKLFVVYIILYTDRKFILIVCNSASLAENFISDVFDMLSTSNIKSVFGDWRLALEKDTLDLKKFAFRGRELVVAGAGSFNSLRGLNIKLVRPDVIIMDDMQSREEAENPDVAKKLLLWMFGTLLKARNYERCLALFIGNMYPFDGSILKKLKYNPQWKSLICGGILADGNSLWPEFRPVSELLAELENDTLIGHPELFYSEVMNDEEASGSSGVNLSEIPACPSSFLDSTPEGGFIVIDPASGKKSGDDVAIGLSFIIDGVPVLRKLVFGTFTPSETIEQVLKLALEHGIALVAVEAVAYQSTLLHWFSVVCESLNISGINFVELSPKNQAKNTRIKNGLISCIKQELYLSPEVRPHVITQAVNWNPLKTNNRDDVLDIVAYQAQVMEKYRELCYLLHSPDLSQLTDDASHIGELIENMAF